MVLVLCGLLAAAAAAAGTSSGASSHTSPNGCDKTLGGLKTLSDPERGLVDLRPRTTTIRAINKLVRPRPTPTRREGAFQRHVWRVRAVIVRDRIQDDGDIQMILVAGHSYMVARFPAPACLPGATRARAAMVRSRRRFEQGCGTASRYGGGTGRHGRRDESGQSRPGGLPQPQARDQPGGSHGRC